MTNEKLRKTAGVIDVFMKIFQVISVVAVVAAAACILVVLIAGDSFFEAADSITFDSLELQINNFAQYVDLSMLSMGIVSTLVFAMLYLVVFFYGLRVFRNILQPMKDGRPFDMGVSRKIRKLAIVFLIGGCLEQLGTAVEGFINMLAIDGELLLEGTDIAYMSYTSNIDLNFVFTALVIFLLSYIFQYGEMLQKESDETL